MSEVWFYHLERSSLDTVLPDLVEKTLERGWRALIICDTAERASAIDSLLWTHDDQSFLPHAQAGEGDPARQPVLIGVEQDNRNDANVMFLVGGAVPHAWDSEAISRLSRVILIFDGRDSEALAQARDAWKQAGAAGHAVTYWRQSAGGKWEKQA
ncbi:MAG: DNA polymerase III subunit chi [Alphaproteobacteria bacterium]|nr:DNA polymerase III subunit chi [Alphaproteobacteria bacterium]